MFPRPAARHRAVWPKRCLMAAPATHPAKPCWLHRRRRQMHLLWQLPRLLARCCASCIELDFIIKASRLLGFTLWPEASGRAPEAAPRPSQGLVGSPRGLPSPWGQGQKLKSASGADPEAIRLKRSWSEQGPVKRPSEDLPGAVLSDRAYLRRPKVPEFLPLPLVLP